MRGESLQRVARRDWPLWLVAGATFANGALGVLHSLFTRVPESPRLGAVLPFGLHHWSRLLTLATGFLLLYLAHHLRRRRRAAWWLATIASVVAAAAHLGRGHHTTLAVAPGTTAVLLLLFRRRFTVHYEPVSVARGVGLVVISLVAALAYGTLGFWLLDRRDFGINFRLHDAWIRILRQYSLAGNPDLVPHTRHARWFLDSLQFLGLTAGLIAVYSLFRPLAFRLRTLPHERAQAAEILAVHGRSALDHFKLWPDKSFYFSPSGRSFIAYRAALGCAISLGDPAGPPDELEETVRRFASFCADNGWQLAFHQTLPDALPLYRQLGMHELKVGEEALVDLQVFITRTQEASGFQRVRRRAQTLGLQVTRHEPPHPEVLFDEVQRISNEWLSLPGRRERSFTLGRFDHARTSQTPFFVVRDRSGSGLGFVNLIPCYPEGDSTIDLMRHRVEVPNGTMDFLFLEVLLALSARYRRFSLGLAPLSGVGDRPGAPLEERAVHQVYERLNRFFSYKGLRAYKAKFEPAWEERFLVYEGGPAGLVRAGLALTRVTEG